MSDMQPHYAFVPAPIGTSILCCGWCGAHVPQLMQDTHNAWHSQINQIASQASHANAMTTPIGG